MTKTLLLICMLFISVACTSEAKIQGTVDAKVLAAIAAIPSVTPQPAPTLVPTPFPPPAPTPQPTATPQSAPTPQPTSTPQPTASPGHLFALIPYTDTSAFPWFIAYPTGWTKGETQISDGTLETTFDSSMTTARIIVSVEGDSSSGVSAGQLSVLADEVAKVIEEIADPGTFKVEYRTSKRIASYGALEISTTSLYKEMGLRHVVLFVSDRYLVQGLLDPEEDATQVLSSIRSFTPLS